MAEAGGEREKNLSRERGAWALSVLCVCVFLNILWVFLITYFKIKSLKNTYSDGNHSRAEDSQWEEQIT